MPHFTLNTSVRGEFQEVFSRFDHRLFNYLLPPSNLVEVTKYGGNKVGDEVHVTFKFPVKASMHVVITEVVVSENHAYFVDEGLVLPFGLTKWKHLHHVYAQANGSSICDEIHFKSRFYLLDIIYFPIIWLSILARRKPYQRYFNQQ